MMIKILDVKEEFEVLNIQKRIWMYWVFLYFNFLSCEKATINVSMA